MARFKSQCRKDDKLWLEIQTLILENPSCLEDRFVFARICHHLASTDAAFVKIKPELLDTLLLNYRTRTETSKWYLNEKDINNLISMLQAENVKESLTPES